MNVYEGNEKYIFISYAHKDSPLVLPIIEELDEAGFRVWYDGGIAAGTEWPEYIADHLIRAELVLFFISENALNSQNCTREINYAVSKKKKMLAIHLEEKIVMTPGVEMQLGSLQNMFYRRFIDRRSFIAKLIGEDIVRSCSPDYLLTDKNSDEDEDFGELSAFFGTEKAKKKMHREAVSDYADTIPVKIYKGSVTDDDQARIRNNARIINQVLLDLKLRSLVFAVEIGPRVTTYSLTPDPSVRPALLEKFKSDIALSLSIPPENIRLLSPMIGEQRLAVEITNNSQSVIRLDELMEEAALRERMNIETYPDTSVCLGRTTDGEAMFADIAKMPHLLISGISATGKTTLLHSMIVSVITRVSPDRVKFMLVDLKSIEFSVYDNMPHLLVPVIKKADEAASAMRWLCEEMDRRYAEFAKFRVRNVDSYNESVTDGDIMPKLILIIDDYTDLIYNHKKVIEESVVRLSQKSRAAGIHVILSTQRPEVNTITGLIKANIPSKMVFKTTSDIESRTAIDSTGATLLTGVGDVLYYQILLNSIVRVHTPFIEFETVEKIAKRLIKKLGTAKYDSSVEAAIEADREKSAADKEKAKQKKSELDIDDFIADAALLAATRGNLTTSYLQRIAHINYQKATKIMDTLTDMGIISEANGSKPRQALIDVVEWEKKFGKSESETK